jgi:UDPglucose 6-dehydrogenase
MKITIIGMDFVGLVNTVGFAEKGHQVFALDSDKKKIAALRRNEVVKNEYKLEEILSKNDVNIRFTSEYRDSIYDANCLMFCIELKESEPGQLDMAPLYNVAKEACKYINQDVTVILRTTVPVGTNRAMKEYMETCLEHKFKVDVVSNPEFLSQGTAMKDMLTPARIVVGVNTNNAKNVMKELYKGFDAPLLFVSPESAELIKYAANAYLAVKLSYINEIADLCDKVGADIQQVSFGIGLDQRIGNKYLSSGVGFGGPGIPQDTRVLQELAKENDVKLSIVNAAYKVNDDRPNALINKISEITGGCAGRKFAVLGLSYKGNADDIRESPAFKVVEKLLAEDAKVVAYDSVPSTAAAFRKKMKSDQHLTYALTLDEALKTCDYAIFLNDSEEFKNLTDEQICEYMKHPTVFDGKAVLNPNKLPNVTYYAIGKKTR